MSSHGAIGHPIPAHDRGHRLAVWSMFMIPFLAVSAVAGGLLGFAILSANSLEGSEPMSVQGTPGWVAFGLSTVIFMTPMVIGLILGAKGRRLGDRLGTIGMVIDGAILVGYTTIALVNVLSS